MDRPALLASLFVCFKWRLACQEPLSSPPGQVTWRGKSFLCDLGHFCLTSLSVCLESVQSHIETLATRTLTLSASSEFLSTPYCNFFCFPLRAACILQLSFNPENLSKVGGWSTAIIPTHPPAFTPQSNQNRVSEQSHWVCCVILILIDDFISL